MTTRSLWAAMPLAFGVLALSSDCATTRGMPVSRVPMSIPADFSRVSFPSHDADIRRGIATQLTGFLGRPHGEGPFRAMILLHGCGGLLQPDGKIAERDRDWAEKLVARGYVVLMPDSFHPRGVSTICRSQQTIQPGIHRARDAYGALRYLQQLPFVRADAVGVMGWSNGALSVLSTIREKSRARPADLLHDFRVAVAFYPLCAPYLKDQEWSTRTPLTILIGDRDDWTPASACVPLIERTKQFGTQAELITYAGAHHDFDAPRQPLRRLHGLTTTESGEATIGTNEAARADCQRRVPEILEHAFAR